MSFNIHSPATEQVEKAIKNSKKKKKIRNLKYLLNIKAINYKNKF